MQIYDDKSFENPVEIISAFDNKSFSQAFRKLDDYKDKYYLLGYIRYEAKNIFSGKNYSSSIPLLYFEIFKKYSRYKPKLNDNIFYPDIIPQISKDRYMADVNKIKDYIKNGTTYEVNYTYPSKLKTVKSGLSLYETILKNQKTPYNTFMENEYETLLSFSPELFFKIKNNKIITKPMKGTISRGLTETEDRKNIEFLKNDIKNKSENTMIVDLLRNDLCKISKTGTVRVERLFEIETHKTVHQMTSAISGELRENITLYDIFESLFPCGSVTGAPKISTMTVIDELEPYERGIYCGAVGLISPDEIIFSVPIRILQKTKTEEQYTVNSGGAIVWDSNPIDEWEETKIKQKFLFAIDNFNLIETMKVENGSILFFKEHIERLKNSAFKLGFKFNCGLYNIKPQKDGILRIVLQKSGKFEVSYRDLDIIETNKIRFAGRVSDTTNPLLYHKTDCREWYKVSMDAIKRGEVFDEIYTNENGEITEGTRSNIVIKKDGRLYTPPVKSGLLNGIYRQIILKQLTEKTLYKTDLVNADKIYCINSVRGMVEVKLFQ
ncbi:MAG: bifunctional anthranilate synthase component I family protein/aminotransferase class IV [Candidatus Gastranaerophilales bacterium]|nr:bifunctional anthranilate synthase component I family protein/aminotransferase class IV [Candidatus Gastranaerophilales bacterium]